MTKILPALGAVVLGGRQMKRHHLIPIARMFEGALVGRLDPDPIVLAIDARRTFATRAIWCR